MAGATRLTAGGQHRLTAITRLECSVSNVHPRLAALYVPSRGITLPAAYDSLAKTPGVLTTSETIYVALQMTSRADHLRDR